MGMQPMPEDNPGLRRLHRHAHATDPARFMVADRSLPGGGTRVVGVRVGERSGAVWFLSMLFVRPAPSRPGGIGAGAARAAVAGRPRRRARVADLPRTAPSRSRTRCTPVRDGARGCRCSSSWAGRRQPSAGRRLPPGVRAQLGHRPGARSDERGAGRVRRALLGFAHPQDHRFLRTEPRHLFHSATEAATLGAYGYAGGDRSARSDRRPRAGARGSRARPPADDRPAARRLRDLAARGGTDVASPPRSAPGSGSRAFRRSLCWNRPIADFSRYIPNSPALV